MDPKKERKRKEYLKQLKQEVDEISDVQTKMREEGDAKRQEELQRDRQAKQQELKRRRDRAWEGKVKV